MNEEKCGRSKEVNRPELIGQRVRVTMLRFHTHTHTHTHTYIYIYIRGGSEK